MVRYLPWLLELGLLLFALIDCAQTEPHRVRGLPKLPWVLIIIVIPFVGPLAWFLAGRPTAGPSRPRASAAPDDDPVFLEGLRRNREHEDLLKKWEDDLKRRENDIRDEGPSDGTHP